MPEYVTESQMREIAKGYRAAKPEYLLSFVQHPDILEKYGMTTPQRLAALIATAAAETGGFTISAENMNYSADRIRQVWPSRPEAVKFAHKPRELANCVYGSRLGNRKGTDDGYNMRGQGMNQLTGRENFERAEKATGLPLLTHPELLATDGRAALEVLCWELAKFTKYADKGAAGWRAVSNGVNRGNPLASADPIGWKDRQTWYAKVSRALKAKTVNPNKTADVGHSGDDIQRAQMRLRELGYVMVGTPNGVYGPKTELAVFAFQRENSITASGKLTPQTSTALFAATAKPFPADPERAATTAAELSQRGDTTVQYTYRQRVVGWLLGLLGGGGAVSEVANPVSTAQHTVETLNTYRTLTEQFRDLVLWAGGNWRFVALGALVAAGAYFVYSARHIESKRVSEHQTGENTAL